MLVDVVDEDDIVNAHSPVVGEIGCVGVINDGVCEYVVLVWGLWGWVRWECIGWKYLGTVAGVVGVHVFSKEYVGVKESMGMSWAVVDGAGEEIDFLADIVI